MVIDPLQSSFCSPAMATRNHKPTTKARMILKQALGLGLRPSGKLWNITMLFMGELTISTGPFSIDRLNYQGESIIFPMVFFSDLCD